MSFVLDASICLSWLMPDENHPDAAAAFAALQNRPAVAPVIWWFEIRNSLLVAERKRRLRGITVEELLRSVSELPVKLRTDIDQELMLRLARKHRLTFYDAAYLAVATAEHLALATLDGDLLAAAIAEGVPLVTS